MYTITKTVLIPTEFKRIDKTRWHQYVKSFLESPDANSIHAERGTKIARNLKAMGLPVEQIMLATGLTQEEANEL